MEQEMGKLRNIYFNEIFLYHCRKNLYISFTNSSPQAFKKNIFKFVMLNIKMLHTPLFLFSSVSLHTRQTNFLKWTKREGGRLCSGASGTWEGMFDILQLLNVWHMLVQGKYAQQKGNEHKDQINWNVYFLCPAGVDNALRPTLS